MLQLCCILPSKILTHIFKSISQKQNKKKKIQFLIKIYNSIALRIKALFLNFFTKVKSKFRILQSKNVCHNCTTYYHHGSILARPFCLLMQKYIFAYILCTFCKQNVHKMFSRRCCSLLNILRTFCLQNVPKCKQTADTAVFFAKQKTQQRNYPLDVCVQKKIVAQQLCGTFYQVKYKLVFFTE